MILKVNGEFLDFDGDIDIERKAKLFENISENSGDFSYEFQIPDTSGNRAKLGIQDINIVDKLIYRDTDSELLSDSGELIYYGFLKVRNTEGGFINTSFFSGNSNWIAKLPAELRDVNLDRFNIKQQDTLNAPLLRSAELGVIFPFMDSGLLSTRNARVLNFDDYRPWIYAKTVVESVLNQAGIKFQGDIKTDPIFNKLVLTNNNNSWYQQFITDRSCFVGITSDLLISTGAFSTIIVYDDDSTNQYSSGINYNTANGKYTADVDMTVDVEIYSLLETHGSVAPNTSVSSIKNGVTQLSTISSSFTVNLTLETSTIQISIFRYTDVKLKSGDYIEFQGGTLYPSPVNLYVGSYARVTAKSFRDIYANSILPDFTTSEFLDGVFNLFNTIIDFNSVTNTATINLFKNVKSKEPQDLSQYVSRVINTDYFEFIDEYGKVNTFRYVDVDLDEVKQYKVVNRIPFGGGNINLDNKYIKPMAEVVDSPFANMINYDNPIFNANIAKAPLVSASEGDTVSVTSVSNSSTFALFTCASNHNYSVGDLVRLSGFTEYSGDGIVEVIPSSTQFRLTRYLYIANDTGESTKLDVSIEDSECHIGLVVPNVLTSSFGFSPYSIHNGSYSESFSQAHYIYFSKKLTGNTIDDVNGDLSFGDINLQNYDTKVNMIDNYFSEFKRILNDPIKVICEMYLPEAVFRNITFSRPVRVSSVDVNSLFYLNRISGYKGSHLPCEVELIKLS